MFVTIDKPVQGHTIFFSWMFWNFDSFIYCLHFINNSQSAVCILSVSLDLMLSAMFSFKQAIKQFKFISSSTSLKYLWSPVRGDTHIPCLNFTSSYISIILQGSYVACWTFVSELCQRTWSFTAMKLQV